VNPVAIWRFRRCGINQTERNPPRGRYDNTPGLALLVARVPRYRMTFADLKNDFVFRRIFAKHPDILRGLLNDLLDRRGEQSIEARA
jgi:hypothetical protein